MLQLNLKAIRKFTEDNNLNKSNDYFIASVPYSNLLIKVSKTEQDTHFINNQTGFEQIVAKVFEDKVFLLTSKFNRKEVEGTAIYLEELGLKCIEMDNLRRKLKTSSNNIITKRKVKI